MTWETVTPLTDDEPAVGRYEQTFHIGQRVRVRLSGECNDEGFMAEGYSGEVLAENLGHADWENNRAGTVIAPHADADPDDHPIRVKYDAPQQTQYGICRDGYYAACELEAL